MLKVAVLEYTVLVIDVVEKVLIVVDLSATTNLGLLGMPSALPQPGFIFSTATSRYDSVPEVKASSSRMIPSTSRPSSMEDLLVGRMVSRSTLVPGGLVWIRDS